MMGVRPVKGLSQAFTTQILFRKPSIVNHHSDQSVTSQSRFKELHKINNFTIFYCKNRERSALKSVNFWKKDSKNILKIQGEILKIKSNKLFKYFPTKQKE